MTPKGRSNLWGFRSRHRRAVAHEFPRNSRGPCQPERFSHGRLGAPVVSPMAPKRPCGSPRCPEFRPCPRHGRRPWEHDRPSASARGYGTEWRRRRAVVLREEPTCGYCGRAPSTTVDHVVPKTRGGTDDRENLRGACKRCHDTKSAREGQASRLTALLQETRRSPKK